MRVINSPRQHKIEDNNFNNLLKHNFVKPVTNKKEQHTYLSLSLFLNKHNMFHNRMISIRRGPHSGRLRLITGPFVKKSPLESDLQSAAAKCFCILYFLNTLIRFEQLCGKFLFVSVRSATDKTKANQRCRITRTHSFRFFVNYGSCFPLF